MVRSWMIRSGFFFLLAVPAGGGAQAAPLSATFLQLQAWMIDGLTEKDWIAELELMRGAGIDTIVLQWVKYDGTRFYPVHTSKLDPIATILRYADEHKMNVFLGLSFDSAWWEESDNAGFLRNEAARAGETAGKLARRYGAHPSLSGWYLPHEVGDIDYDDEELAHLRDFFRRVGTACRKQSKRKLPVAMSLFFSGRLPPAALGVVTGKLLKGSGIDIVIVQDGVGTHGWEGKTKEKVTPYLARVAESTKTAGARLWAAVEVFAEKKDAAGKPQGRVPADGPRLVEQLQAVSALVERTVIFDFFHYLSPRRGEPQRVLYQWYSAHRSALVGR